MINDRVYYNNTSNLEEEEEKEEEQQQRERAYWSQWAIEVAEKERQRRLEILHAIDLEEEKEILRRRQWALEAIEKEQAEMMRELFLSNMKNTHWFQSTISHFAQNYEVVCPHSWFGCTFSCMLKDLDQHVAKCVYRQVPDRLDQVYEQENLVDLSSYDVVCPNALLGCNAICAREHLAQHLATKCSVNTRFSREKEMEERLIWRKNVIQATEQERTRRIHEETQKKKTIQLSSTSSSSNCQQQKQQQHEQIQTSSPQLLIQRLYEKQTKQIQILLHQEMIFLANQNEQDMIRKKPLVQKAIDQIQAILFELWPKKNAIIQPYGSFITNLHGEFSDVDLLVTLF
jgi:non-canonical poly(A) RNA polymerase PAPD5/7